jgi:mono/diheme cytochrome c family protein
MRNRFILPRTIHLGTIACAIALFAAPLFMLEGCGTSSENPGDTTNAPSSGAPATRQASPIPLSASFRSLNQNIFSQKCVSCHNSTTASGQVDFTSFDSLVHNPKHSDVVVAGKPDESHLYEVLKTGEMPPNGTALSAAEIQAVSDWITQGAQDN